MEAVADKKEVRVVTTLQLDYLNDSSVRLYFPMDLMGNVVHPTKAKVFECWEVRPERRPRAPSIFDKERIHSLAMALLAKQGDSVYASFWHCVQNTTGLQLREWALYLYRQPDGDILGPIVDINTR